MVVFSIYLNYCFSTSQQRNIFLIIKQWPVPKQDSYSVFRNAPAGFEFAMYETKSP